MESNGNNTNSSKYILVIVAFLLFSLLIFATYIFFIRSSVTEVPKNESLKTEMPSESEDSLSDLFEKSIEDTNSLIIEKGQEEGNCVLLKEVVPEGTVIFDSTCSVETE